MCSGAQLALPRVHDAVGFSSRIGPGRVVGPSGDAGLALAPLGFEFGARVRSERWSSVDLVLGWSVLAWLVSVYAGQLAGSRSSSSPVAPNETGGDPGRLRDVLARPDLRAATRSAQRPPPEDVEVTRHTTPPSPGPGRPGRQLSESSDRRGPRGPGSRGAELRPSPRPLQRAAAPAPAASNAHRAGRPRSSSGRARGSVARERGVRQTHREEPRRLRASPASRPGTAPRRGRGASTSRGRHRVSGAAPRGMVARRAEPKGTTWRQR